MIGGLSDPELLLLFIQLVLESCDRMLILCDFLVISRNCFLYTAQLFLIFLKSRRLPLLLCDTSRILLDRAALRDAICSLVVS